MKKWKRLILINSLFVMFIGADQISATERKDYQEIQVQDVSGDKIRDRLVVKGTPLNDQTLTLTNLTLQISFGNNHNKPISITLPDGRKPFLTLTDLNHDSIKDVFVVIEPSNQEETVKALAFSFKDGKQVSMDAPLPVNAQASFLNDYKAEIKVFDKTFKIDVSSRKEMYEKLGFYHNGKLNEPIELIIGEYSILKPTYILQGRGLVGIQKVSGVSDSDKIGILKSTWFFQGGEWKLKNVSFKNMVTKSK
ncbi:MULTISPECIES: hypothetical protein [Bacillus]|uniref:hypothetical protein n=1 Tax=Bacillus TaxID=1386 RepID=UPI0002F3EE62|nr:MULTISPECIES: hypothetical protein [Bacillus]